jgi:hypothetical protein
VIQDKPVLIVFSYHLAINLYLRFFPDRQERVNENEKDKGKQNGNRKADLGRTVRRSKARHARETLKTEKIGRGKRKKKRRYFNNLDHLCHHFITQRQNGQCNIFSFNSTLHPNPDKRLR